ncbi:MAG: hypothetical protein J6Y26_04715 [Lachnospiraceae bacterium]|nr:hypothetical protein [Lachnospiraceae bacterium]
MKGYTIYDLHETHNTASFYGHAIVIDGERGRDTFPGKWAHCDAREYYRSGRAWYELAPGRHTYIIALDGQYYALAADTLVTTIYALGPDRKPDSINAQYFTGSVAERNDAIRSICSPHTWRDAINIARSSGSYVGQLYAD